MELLERKQFFDELQAIPNEVAAGHGRFVALTIGSIGVVEAKELGRLITQDLS